MRSRGRGSRDESRRSRGRGKKSRERFEQRRRGNGGAQMVTLLETVAN